MIVNVNLNGKFVTGKKGESILELARRQGVQIPTLCHDDRLEPYTSCYICVVEVDGMKGLQPSCSTLISEGMKIETNNGKIYKARKTALDLLLSNHYADCAAPCKQTCPAGVDVQGYISLIEKGLLNEAIGLIKETNPLPAICGRVCVRPCEVACRRNLLDEGSAVGIDYLKRFAADYDLNSPNKYKPDIKESTGKKVAIIGAGPGGLAAAFFLQKEGHQADIYEASPQPGGWLRYGIPEYRLPNEILDKEVESIRELGVNIHYKQKLGENLSYQALKYKYDAIILAIGSQKGTSVGCEGDDAKNVLSGIDFLRNIEMSGKKYDFKGKKVAVIGGGNTAMDCCRTSKRCGAEKVYVIYRRTENEMPANPIEIHESKIEGVEYMFLTAPLKINKNDKGELVSITCQRMELGEPDASGRRRPVPVEGSQVDIKLDYILAAIGQKTDINFLEEVNRNIDKGELKMNKWGDIDADASTLQTGVSSIFACGDGVTGPATLIQAIGQARIAANSCHQYLSGKDVKAEKKEFLSKKENFKEQKKEDYKGFFTSSSRQEMPTLKADDRSNFKEVELGYADFATAKQETSRCMECGCTEYFDCELKKYATEYDAEQKRFSGDFKEYRVDFRHPFIEIDNNKCILCARCVRICKEVAGANALGLVNRGFKTYVAPSMGGRLQDSNCESCGLCISTCPTAAISENYKVKPGPLQLKKAETICNFCSVGCTIELEHKEGYVMKVTGGKGLVNTDGNICARPKFGMSYVNDRKRITKPLLKTGGKFEEIEFRRAFEIIAEKIKSVKADENAFFAGARLTNEELYLIQKLARMGAGTNNVSSFHYADRGDGYIDNHIANMPFSQIQNASKFYLIGSEINHDNPVAGFMINNAKYLHNIPLQIIIHRQCSSMEKKADSVLRIKDYYNFIKATNHYLLSRNLQNSLFINDNCDGYKEYSKCLLKEDYQQLIINSGASREQIESFAEDFNNQMNAVLFFSEKEISSNCSKEIYNLAMLTGKLGKTGMGIISLKEKNNSRGLMDMGIHPTLSIGGVSLKAKNKKLLQSWGIDKLPIDVNTNLLESLQDGKMKNVFIFGEDPIGCHKQGIPALQNILSKTEFVVVQDYFLTETAEKANLILPATMGFETGGTYSNTQKTIQKFEATLNTKVEVAGFQQIATIMEKFGGKKYSEPEDIMMEVFSLLPDKQETAYSFRYTTSDNPSRIFEHGCDYVQKHFDEMFSKSLYPKKVSYAYEL